MAVVLKCKVFKTIPEMTQFSNTAAVTTIVAIHKSTEGADQWILFYT